MFHYQDCLDPLKTLKGRIHEFSVQGDVQQAYIDSLIAIKPTIVTKIQKKSMKTLVDTSDEVANACMDQLPPDMQDLVTKDFIKDFVGLMETAQFNGVTFEKAVELGLAPMP
jgi:hypothetical protein